MSSRRNEKDGAGVGNEKPQQRAIRIRLVRTTSFSSAHRYHDPRMSDHDNRQVYGSLYREKGFGHNFRLEAEIEGDVDPLTGMIVNLTEFDSWLNEVRGELDHRFLNDLPAFKNVAPTAERIASHCFARMKALLKREDGGRGLMLTRVRLYEGDHFWVDTKATTSGSSASP
jgi:6-pyruvoyltetrahydropterin/6-carboxytetrahydropterin synthase